MRHRPGSTRYLLHWQFEWLKRFLRTWYHILYRPAYWRWKEKQNVVVRRRCVSKAIRNGLLDAAENGGVELTEDDFCDIYNLPT